MRATRQPYIHKDYEIQRDDETGGGLRIVRQLDTIRSKNIFRKFCMENYWHNRKPLRLAFQLEGNSNEPYYEVIPHASTGRPSICFILIAPDQGDAPSVLE